MGYESDFSFAAVVPFAAAKEVSQSVRTGEAAFNRRFLEAVKLSEV